MYYNKVEICGIDTSKLKVLTEKEKTELLKLAKSGDNHARNELITGNLRLVLSVIQRFSNRGENPDDLFQVGCIGLMKAIDNFDTCHDVKFSTYAVPIVIEGGKRKVFSTMTRKQALNQAIYILSQSEGNGEIIEKLQDLLEELPIIHWSDKSIHDRVQQFIEDEGRNPTASDFRKKGMPPHPVIKQKYKITLAEWLEQNYPTIKPSVEELKEKYTKQFIEDYNRIKPKSQEEFNQNRTKGTKGWQTVAKYHNVNSWRKLIKSLELPLYFELFRDRTPMTFNVTVTTDLDFI